MKRIHIYFIAIASFIVGLTSCGKDFLEITHYDIVTPDVYLQSGNNLEMGLNGIYDLLLSEWVSGAGDIPQNWNLKPQIAFSNYPARDMQPDGWDQEFGFYAWKPDFYMFGPAWLRAYRTIDRVNIFLENLEIADPGLFSGGQTTKNNMIAESRAIRAWFYTFLLQSWGNVPILLTGETYLTSPGKTRGTTAEAWNLIIEDYEFARDNLDWKPRNGEYGRVTKGMAKAYLGLAYMYQGRWADAKKELKDVIDCGEYELTKCYAYIHLESKKWQKESVWEIAYNDWSGTGYMIPGYQHTYTDAVWRGPRMFAAAEYGGLGPSTTSFEFVWSHEPGDKRLTYNVSQYGEFNIGYSSVTLGEPGSAQIGVTNSFAQPYVGAYSLPNNYNMKLWSKNHQGSEYHAFPVTYMRLAGVMLNYAECCFETNDMAEGWNYIKIVRDRAWGKLEVGIPTERGKIVTLNDDPTVEAPDAETYYSTYKRAAGRNGGMVNKFLGWMPNKAGTADSLIRNPQGNSDNRIGLYERRYYEATTSYKPYTSPAWKVALIMERRHELYGEYSFWQDLCRMGVAKEYLDAEYPVNDIPPITVDLAGLSHADAVKRLIDFDYSGRIQSEQPNEFDPTRMIFPIPQTEMDANPALTKDDQNPGY